jgi:hypothetical protein
MSVGTYAVLRAELNATSPLLVQVKYNHRAVSAQDLCGECTTCHYGKTSEKNY